MSFYNIENCEYFSYDTGLVAKKAAFQVGHLMNKRGIIFSRFIYLAFSFELTLLLLSMLLALSGGYFWGAKIPHFERYVTLTDTLGIVIISIAVFMTVFLQKSSAAQSVALSGGGRLNLNFNKSFQFYGIWLCAALHVLSSACRCGLTRPFAFSDPLLIASFPALIVLLFVIYHMFSLFENSNLGKLTRRQ